MFQKTDIETIQTLFFESFFSAILFVQIFLKSFNPIILFESNIFYDSEKPNKIWKT